MFFFEKVNCNLAFLYYFRTAGIFAAFSWDYENEQRMEQMDKTDALHRKTPESDFQKRQKGNRQGKEKMKERQL